MPNMDPKKTPMPEQEAEVRNKNFDEVALGYTEVMAKLEAQRCLNCKHRPCVGGCPVNINIPDFISAIAQGEYEKAYEIIKETNSLPAVCGRVCPQESQCEKYCVRGIKGESVGIGRLERFAADYHMKSGDKKPERPASNGIKVAIIGSGPAGLACAGDLAKMGYDVTIFEAFHIAGGVLMYGIPEFRLPKEIVRREIEDLKHLGVKIEVNSVVGRVVSVDEFLSDEGFAAVFIGTGAGLPSFMKIPGENFCGVYSSNEFLTRINLMKGYRFPEYDTPVKIGKRVAVVGGGNVAMDAARCAKRLGADEVHIIYRRSMDELPARAEEVHHAVEEGIIFNLLKNPVRIIGEDGWVTGIECVEMELGEPDESGRRRPKAKAGTEKVIPVDTVIIAIGQTPNPLIKSTTPDIETQKWGGIIVDEATGRTSKKGVFAGGDAVTGAATVILAMGAGKQAAAAIDEYIKTEYKNT
ncbi:MAG: Glutamate synthase (NADPH) small chain [Firmicutes bacterium ADurb.Bin193]|nr:MAG: Glutamate synthase (NADPH) small chain [Firmicutes bacterium ADurb.Bin193]